MRECGSVVIFTLEAMRLARLFLMFVALVAASACRSDVDTPTPEPAKADFEVTLGEVTRSTVTFAVTPAESIGDYVCVVEKRSVVEEYTRDEYVIATVLQEFAEEASNKGKTYVEYMPTAVENGAIAEALFSGLQMDTDYYILLFGVDAERGYEASTALTKVEFKTGSVASQECTFEVTTAVVDNSVTIGVKPSDKEIYWYLCTMPAAQYDYYVTDENGYQFSEGYFYEYYFQQDINAYRNAGYTDQQIIDAIIHQGDVELEAKGLQQHTEYYILVAGLILDSEGIVICTDIAKASYVTEAAAKSEMTFEIEVWDIGQMSASVRITPSNDKDTYCALIQPWDGVSTADEVMHQLVDQWGGWMDLMANDRGMVEHVGSNAFKLPAADTDYYVIAFGYQGGITTEAYMKTFHTLPGGSVEEVEFTINATNISPYGFNMNITSSDPSIYYVPGACVAGEFDEEEYIKYEEEAFDYYYNGSKNFNPSITIAEVLDQYYYNGNSTVQVSGLQPDTEIMAYIFALDNRTGKVVKTFIFDSVARTDTLGEAAPTIELVGYFSGDDEAGAVFGDAAATAGRVITVVKYNNLDNVRTLFTTMAEGDCSNPQNYSDAELWSITSGYWKTCKISSPYTFYLVDWNVEQTALAYGVDHNGKSGAISRLYTLPTAENKGDVELLKELVKSLE